METTNQHWSGPNGCAEGCPACAEATTAKHTAGPFIIREQPGFLTLEVERDGLRSVLATASESGLCPEHGGTAAGNMELYAAAPDLLAACRQLVATCDALAAGGVVLPLSVVDCYESARAAIAKGSRRCRVKPPTITRNAATGFLVASDDQYERDESLARAGWADADCDDVSDHPVYQSQLAAIWRNDKNGYCSLTESCFSSDELAEVAALNGWTGGAQ